MFYIIKIPWWLKKLYSPSFVWNIPTKEKILYLTFDDGPHETATPFVLDQLKKYNANATFFCIGKNVVEQPEIYQRIIDEGHKTGNHTHNHLNGWKTDDKTYFENIFEAAKYIHSNLFRPPYGKITKFQAKILSENVKRETSIADSEKENHAAFIIHYSPFTIIMWNVLSGDFDENISPEKCLQNVMLNTKSGSIIVFHDSAKAFERMSYALPKTLEYFSENGFMFKAIE